MGRQARLALTALLALVVMPGTVTSALAVAEITGSETMDGGLVATGASGKRRVTGTVVALRGAFTGVGRIVERPNRPGDSDKVSRDDLVFAEGAIHIVNRNGRMTLSVNRRTCTATFKVQQTTTIAGGSKRFAGATGGFAGTIAGTAVAFRKADGSCDPGRPPLVEVDTFHATGTLTF